MQQNKKRQLTGSVSAGQIIVFSFVAVIMLGTILLMLPISLAPGEQPDFMTALFTATSCTCVTGLVVVESGLHYSLFGQIVLITLIQIGGLGFMTLVMLLAVILGKRISLRDRLMIRETMSASSLQGMIPVLRDACRLTFTCELGGALLLTTRFIPKFGWLKGIWYSVFHAVSAFCNAGFDVLGRGDSVSSLNGDPIVMLTLMALIVLGGLGFPVIMDVIRTRRFSRLTLHSRVVLLMTALLLSIGFFFTLAFEAGNPATLGPMPWWKKILNAAFQTVTLRTAGFASFSQDGLTPLNKLVSSAMMFIGASPASTGGGIKTTVMACTLTLIVSAVKGSKSSVIRGRRLAQDLIYRAAAIFLIAFGAVIALTLCLTALEPMGTPGFSVENVLYEACSALGTAGLTTGITPRISTAGRLLLILAMFMGRVGPLTLTLSFTGKQNKNKVRIEYPEDHIIVG